MNLEKTILRNLLTNKDYCSKVIPFIKEEYFIGEDKILFTQINSFILKYNQSPTMEALDIEIDNTRGATDEEIKACKTTLDDWKTTEPETPNEKWLLDSTEEFCQERAIYIAMTKSIEIMNGKNKTLQKGAIPSILSEALAISFDPNVGHDYFENADDRFTFYHRVEEKIPFDLEFFNKITKGGLPKKTLNIALAGCVHPATKVRVRFRKIVDS
jgi:hypothetical protein